MKIIAFYLPQYHEFEENNRWWGKGFTEWTNTKNAVPIFKGHVQPHEPLDGYYDLAQADKVFRYQIDLAKKYGIYGFCFYHYWFDKGKQLMEEPLEAYLNNKELDFPFCFCWANHSWTRTWTGDEKEILMEQKYGDVEEQTAHFDYLKRFFRDERYIKIDNKPVLVIFRPDAIPDLKQRLDFLNQKAKEEGFDGLVFISEERTAAYDMENPKYDCLDYFITYQPSYVTYQISQKLKKTEALTKHFGLFCSIMKQNAKKAMGKLFHRDCWRVTVHNYDVTWKEINAIKYNDRMIPCAFANWDNTPRRGSRGVLYNSTPDKFKKYFPRFVQCCREQNKDIVFFNAWNEWGEGAYLEPDTLYKHRYLEIIKDSLEEKGK